MLFSRTGDLSVIDRSFFSPSIAIFASFMAYLANSNVFFVLYYMVRDGSCCCRICANFLQANPIMGISFCLITVRLTMRSRRRSAPSAQYSGSSSTGAGDSQRSTPRKVLFDPDSLLGSDNDYPRDMSKIPLSALHRGDKLGVGESNIV